MSIAATSTPKAVPLPAPGSAELDEYTAEWAALCADSRFDDLPYKVETDRYHRLLMSPAKTEHSYWQTEIAALLKALLPHGKALVECAVATPDGIKVPDVGWSSNAASGNFLSIAGGARQDGRIGEQASWRRWRVGWGRSWRA